ncbi:MAG: arsenate reductase family protein [Parachlamydiaceae bacterium]
MLVYVYSNCSTCQKALKFLKAHRILFTQKEITQEPPAKQELQKMLGFKHGDLKKLFNTSGQLYRDMQLSQKLASLSIDKALELLSSNGMLVKRPFLLGQDFGLLGFKEEEWKKVLNV